MNKYSEIEMKKYNEQKYAEEFEKVARPDIEAGKSYGEFFGNHDCMPGDSDLYEKLEAKIQKEKINNEKFLEGFNSERRGW